MKKQLSILIFLSFICLIVILIVRQDNYLTRTYMINKNYNKNLEKKISKKNIKNYNENFVETLLVAYSLYFMSSDGVVKKPNKKNIAARACMSAEKLNKILEKYNGHLFKISYYTKGKRTYTDSIVLSQELFSLIHVKKNQYRIHQSYVTEMIKTKLPKSPLATLVFYITVMHSNKNGVSSISIKKLTGILSQKYDQKNDPENELKIYKIKKKIFDLHDKLACHEISLKEFNQQRNLLLDEELAINEQSKKFRKIKHYEFNESLEENIRHAIRLLIKNNIIKKENKILFLNLNNKQNSKFIQEVIHIQNIEPGATNNLSKRKEKRKTENEFLKMFSKSQIANKSNFSKLFSPHRRKKILLAKIWRAFKKQNYKKSIKYFEKNKWLKKQSFFCKNLKEIMTDFLRENVKLKNQFYILSRYISSFFFNKKIDWAILLFENFRDFINGKNLFEINWDKFNFFIKLKEIFPL